MAEPNVFSTVEVRPGFSGVSELSIDENGHGTAVTEALRKTLGPAEKLFRITVYKVQEKNKALGVYTPENITSAVTEACSDGNKIINVSMGPEGSSTFTKSFTRKLLNQGCLIVLSSGNRMILSRTNDDPSVVYAEAVYPSGTQPLFSIPGNIAAAGVNVALAMPNSSKLALASIKHNLGCSNNEYLMSGTSFAAPIVSGILGLEMLVLRENTKFIQMPLAEQQQFAVSILLASKEIRGQASDRKNKLGNAVAAISMARMWMSDGFDKNIVDSVQLAKFHKSWIQSWCNQQSDHETVEISHCGQRKSQINLLRKKEALCGFTALNESSLLLKEYIKTKQTELAISQIHDISNGFKNASNAELSESARTILGLSETIKMQPGYNLGDYWIDKTTILHLWISGATKIENIQDATKQIVQVISEGRMLYDYSRTGDDINLRRLNRDYRLFYKLTTLLPEKDFYGLVEAIAYSNTKDNIKAELAKLLFDMNSVLSTDFQKRLRPILKVLVKQANKNYPYFLGNF